MQHLVCGNHSIQYDEEREKGFEGIRLDDGTVTKADLFEPSLNYQVLFPNIYRQGIVKIGGPSGKESLTIDFDKKGKVITDAYNQYVETKD